MLWQGRRESDNVEDRRGITGGHIAAGGGIIGVIVFVLNFLLGGSNDPQLSMPDQGQPMSQQQKTQQDKEVPFVKTVLAETEDVWTQLMQQQANMTYRAPTLVLFTDATQSACGYAQSATGPFYCPGDEKVYIDLSFYDELKNRFKANGDFAEAYVIAHEVGHHVQKLLGISDKIDRLRQQLNDQEFNKYSVRLELQADYFAGVWAYYEEGKGILEKGDIESALNAANQIGDDRLQKQSQGYVVPETFTHGTSAQRMHWFKKGYQTGDIKQGDTFSASDLDNG